MVRLPLGFHAHVGNMGVKDTTDDLCVVASNAPCPAAAVFTRSRFAGPSVTLSRAHVADGLLRAVVVVSKNANVANGAAGTADATELAALVAALIGADPNEVLVSSTGVIGRRYPMDRMRGYLQSLRWDDDALTDDAGACAAAIMTTDTHPKVAEATVGGGPARVVGIAKGVGMIEPDMATLLAFFFTDAEVRAPDLDRSFRAVMDRTLNAVSVDSDTSTSDTAAVLASGVAGPVDLVDLEAALHQVALALTRMVARDGEGATKLLVVTVSGARDDRQAKRVAKSIVNSPLVKTAVHGADPNWGRVAMAIGKCSGETDIDQERVVIRFGQQELFPTPVDAAGLEALTEYLRGDEVHISADLGIAAGSFTVYGCDLSDGYVRINADYTT
jgi:glutamate N-acetyltransferase / amino-acid N-acetyltransferase